MELGVDVLVDEAVPLAQGVQGAEQRHHLLRQRAAVRSGQGSLRAGPPPPQSRLCRTHTKEGLRDALLAHPGHREGGEPPTSEERDIRRAGGEQAAQETEELLHKALHVPGPLCLVP